MLILGSALVVRVYASSMLTASDCLLFVIRCVGTHGDVLKLLCHERECTSSISNGAPCVEFVQLPRSKCIGFL